MKSKLNYLISMSFKRKVKSKWFLIANVLLCILICALINIDSIITAFGGDFNDQMKIYVIDKTGESFNLFKNNVISTVNMTGENNAYDIILYEKDEKEVKKLLEKKEEDGNISVILSNTGSLEATIISKEYLDTLTYSEINNALQNMKITLSLQSMNLTSTQIQEIYRPIEVKRVYLDEGKKSEDENMAMIMTSVFPIFILPFFMLCVFLVQMIGAEVNDEKTTRGMEIIISNVSAKTHFFSKVIANNLFIFMQSFFLILYALLGILIRHLIGGDAIMGGAIDTALSVVKEAVTVGLQGQILYVLPLALLLMALTLIAYSLLAGILASMTTNTEDFQQLQTPIMIISIIGYFLAMMSGVFDGSIFIKLISYVPFISAILSPSLLLMGQIGTVDVLISVILLCGVIVLLIRYGLRIYKVGILNYSSNKLWSKMWKAMRQ